MKLASPSHRDVREKDKRMKEDSLVVSLARSCFKRSAVNVVDFARTRNSSYVSSLPIGALSKSTRLTRDSGTNFVRRQTLGLRATLNVMTAKTVLSLERTCFQRTYPASR